MEKFPGCVGALSTKLMFTQQTFRQVVKNCKLLREMPLSWLEGETTTNNLHKQCPLTFYAPKQNACILQWMLRLLNYYSPDNGAGGEGEIITGMVQTTEAHSNLQPSILKNIRSRCTFLCSLRPRIRFYPIIIG